MKKVLPFLVSLLIFSACANIGSSGSNNSAQKKFGEDSNYFFALQAADKGKEREAQRLFKISRKKSNPLIARRSAEALTLIGSAKERVEAALYLAQAFDDEEALTISCRELFRNGEYARVIELTDNVDIAYSKNELVRLRLESQLEKKDSRFEKDFYKWMTVRPLSMEHIYLYKKYGNYKVEQFEMMQSDVRNFQDKISERSKLELELEPDFSDGDAKSEKNQPEKKLGSKQQRLFSTSYPH